MKKMFFLAGMVALFSCDQPKPIQSRGGIEYNGRFKGLFAQFFNIGLDTLEVHSPDTVTSVFNGHSLDSVSTQFFPAEMAQQHSSEHPALFPIYKFMLDSAHMGLLVRTPSEYESSSIKMFLWDRRKDSLTSYIELAENWGDAGDYMTKTSWLFRDTSSRHIQALIEVFQGHDNSVDNPKDTTREEERLYSLVDFTNTGVDTVFADKKQLPEQYSELLKKRTRN
jgi:hypothetical protein